MLIGALAVAMAVGVTMAATGRPLDLWSAALGGAVIAAVRTGLLPTPRRGRTHGNVSAVGDGRLALDLIEAELTRTTHGGVFSVAVVEVGHAALTGIGGRRGDGVMDELARALVRDTRLDDRVCRTATSDRDVVVVVLPETGSRGARALRSRFDEQVRRHLASAGLSPDDEVRVVVLTHPADRRELLALRRRLEVLDGSQALIEDVRVRGWRPRPVDEPTMTIHLPE